MSNVYTQIAHTTFQQADGPLTAAQWTDVPAFGPPPTPQVVSHILEISDISSGAGAVYWSANPFPLAGTQYAEIAIHNLTGSTSNLAFVAVLLDPVTGAGGFGVQSAPDGLGNIVITTVDNNTSTNVGAVFTKPFVADAVVRLEFFQGVVTTIYNGAVLQSVSGFSSHNTDVGVPIVFLLVFDVITNDTISEFAAGTISAAANPYSVPDCRKAPFGPNASRNVNNTLIYDVQTSSNHIIPPTDSRKAGAPVASGTYPQNSRTPGTFGPGE